MITLTKKENQVNERKVTEVNEKRVILQKNDLAEMLKWMALRINAKNKNNKAFIKQGEVNEIINEIKPLNYAFELKDIDYLVQFAENALPDYNVFYRTIRAIFRRANCIAE